MKIIRLGIYSGILTAINLTTIILAYGIYYLTMPVNKIVFRAPLAGIFTITVFVVWAFLLGNFLPSFLGIKNLVEYPLIWLMSFIWCPVFYVPLHYITQAHLSAFNNILVIWLFQLPVNLLAILILLVINRATHSVRFT